MNSSDAIILDRMSLNRQGVNSGSSPRDDSPEPSPNVLIFPRDQRPFVLPPWGPWSPNLEQPQTLHPQNATENNTVHIHKNFGVIDDESLPSIPDIPSPYSPPPASLFSGEEFPAKSTRKQRPFDELQWHQSKQQQTPSENAFNNCRSTDGKRPNQNYSSHELLPTVLYLKKDLEESQASMYLLKQENKALAAECDRFQREMQRWSEQHTAVLSEKNEQIAQLQNQIESMRKTSKDTVLELEATNKEMKQKIERISNQLEVSDASKERLAASHDNLKDELDAKMKEIKNLKTTLKDQRAESSQKLKESNASYDAKLIEYREEGQSLRLEIDRLKAMQIDAQRNTDNELNQTRKELITMQSKVTDLENDKSRLESESLKKEEELNKLQEKLLNVFSNDEASQVEMKELRSSLADSTEREQRILIDKEARLNASSMEIKKLNDEIFRLKNELKCATETSAALQISSSQSADALRESCTKLGKLRSEKETLENEILSLKTTSSKNPLSKEPTNDLILEVDRLKSALLKANTTCNDLRAERSTLTKRLALYKNNNSPNEANIDAASKFLGEKENMQPSYFKFDDASAAVNDDELISHRLGRIRDVAERSAVAMEHRRELSRLKTEHENEMKLLSERHEQDLKDVFEEAKAEVTARARDLRRHLQGEYENKLSALERRYQSELTRMQRECDQNTAIAEEAMHTAAAEVSTITKQLDKETTARETLENNIRELEHKLVTEKQKSKLSTEFMMNRKQWRRETNNLIASIQQECNTVFAQNIVRTESPRSVTTVRMTEDEVKDIKSGLLDDSCLSRIEQGAGISMSDVAFPVHRTPWKRDGNPKTSYNSPLDVSQALDETEALVRNLVAK